MDQGVAEQQPQHHDLAVGVVELPGGQQHVGGQALDRLGAAHPAGALLLRHRVARHGQQPGGQVALALGDGRQPGQRAVEHLRGQFPGGRVVAGPGAQVAVDVVDVVVVQLPKGASVARDRALQQRPLALHLSGDVAAPAGALCRGHRAQVVDARYLPGGHRTSTNWMPAARTMTTRRMASAMAVPVRMVSSLTYDVQSGSDVISPVCDRAREPPAGAVSRAGRPGRRSWRRRPGACARRRRCGAGTRAGRRGPRPRGARPAPA